MANALGNPLPINTIEDTKTGSQKKIHLNIESAPDQTPSHPQSRTPKQNNRNQVEAEIVDLISLVDSPEKDMTEILFNGKTSEKVETNRVENEDETTNGEHEKYRGRQQNRRRQEEQATEQN